MITARALLACVCSAALVAAFAACSSNDTGTQTSGTQSSGTASAGTTADAAQADAVRKVVHDAMDSAHLRAVLVQVSVDGRDVLTEAFGESMTGVPATTDMRFRNGAVAISYVATALLQLVDEGTVTLDDKLSRWLPQIPNADRVTLGQLAQMTSGYADYILGNQPFDDALYANPFRLWTIDEC